MPCVVSHNPGRPAVLVSPMPRNLFLILLILPTAPAGASNPLHEAVVVQAALDRAGFSPGIIDGKLGPKTAQAIEAFQIYRGLPPTGRLDAATRQALEIDSRSPLITYRITDADVRMVAPPPKKWQDKARAPRLGYESLADLVAERGHCTQGLLARLNPKLDLRRLRAGDEVLIPSTWSPDRAPQAARLDIHLTAKVIEVVDKSGRVVALFHCSIAKDKEKRPSGSARVTSVSRNPEYLFDPKMWPEVKGVDRKLRIPPGPRNPVGLCWIGLSLPGYGIHGTPNPELIGKTGSHGCFRLTNWDALRLARMVRVGTPIRFIERSELARR